MEQNTFNPIQRELLLSELEKVNNDINSEMRHIRTRKSKDDSKEFKFLSEPYHLIKLHLLEERKVMIENLLKANDWVYITQYSASKESLTK
tara:strand:- start:204 stop:476 length:273 start_codon:yes stop_codon:yes gene_type:complete